MKLRLSNASVEKLATTSSKPLLVHDEECRGFCVVVSKTGAKSFYFYGRIQGRPKRIHIGKYPDINVNHARNVCRGIVGDIAKGVHDPGPRKKGGKTLGEVFDDYLEIHAKPSKRTWQRDVITFDTYLAPWRNTAMAWITRAAVSELVIGIAKQPKKKSAAAKTRDLLSSLFSFAIKQGWCEANPVYKTHRPTYGRRSSYLAPADASRFFTALSQLKSEKARDYFVMLLLTGARRNNVASMARSEIDFARALWTIPTEKFKGKRAQVVPLVPEAMAIITRRLSNGGAYVFPGRGKSGHYVYPQTAMERIQKATGLEIRIHDLRRTVGAWQNAAGVPLRVIQQGLGHSSIQTTAEVYTPTEDTAVRNALAAYSTLLLQSATPTPPQDPASQNTRQPAREPRGKASSSKTRGAQRRSHGQSGNRTSRSAPPS